MSRRERNEEGSRVGLTSGAKFILKVGLIIIIAIAVVFTGLWAANSWVTVSQGHALLIVDAQSHTVGEPIIGAAGGLYMNGLSRMVGLQYGIDIYYSTDAVEMWTEWKWDNVTQTWAESARGEYPAVTVLSKDGLSIEVDILVRWSLNTSSLVELYKTYPNLNWKTMAINSIIREKVRDCISNYTAIQVIEERPKITDDLQSKVTNGLLEDALLKKVLINPTIDLRNIDPDPAFVSAVGKKVAAQQAQLQAQYEYERTLTLARGEAEAKIIVANGTKEAIRQIITLTGNTNSTEIAELYMYLETLKVISPNVKFLIVNMGSSGTPIIYTIPANP